LAAGEEANLVFLTSKEEACSYNEAAEIVTKMMINKCKEMELAATELREYCKIQEAEPIHFIPVLLDTRILDDTNICAYI
jgi:hypothetical protein